MSACPSVRMEQLGSHWSYFHEIFNIWVFFEKKRNSREYFKLHSNLTRITGTLHEYQCTFSIILRSVLLRMRNVSDINYKISLWMKPTDALNSNFIGITTLHVLGSLLPIIRSSLPYIGCGTFYADLMTVCYQEQDGDTLPHTVVGVCGEFQRTGRFLQRGIWSQCVVPRSAVPSVRSSL